MNLLGQKVEGVVGSPQHGPQHGQRCVMLANSWKAPTMTSDTGSLLLAITEEGGSGRRCSLQSNMSSDGIHGEESMRGMAWLLGRKAPLKGTRGQPQPFLTAVFTLQVSINLPDPLAKTGVHLLLLEAV